MKIVFHGANASTFLEGFENLLDAPHNIKLVSDALSEEGEVQALREADVVIGVRFNKSHGPIAAKLYQLPSAGYDRIEFDCIPKGCVVSNCFGHEPAIAEYVMSALLARHVPLVEANDQLRKGDWHYWAGGPSGLRTELGDQSIGIVGYGHIGKAVAQRAGAFGMKVHVANRSTINNENLEASYGLDALSDMLSKVDIVINTLPLTNATEGLIGVDAFSAMQNHAIIMNVGRGAVIDEKAMYDALVEKRIGGGIIDTWYVYPSGEASNPMPANLPFHTLDNVIITPHMSAWTKGTISRRQQSMAENINRLNKGETILNLVEGNN